MIKTITNEDKNNGNGPADGGTGNNGWQNLEPVESKIAVLLKDLMDHPGFSELKMNVRFLKKGQKEVVLSSVKQYRFVVNQATNGITEELSRNSAGSKSQ